MIIIETITRVVPLVRSKMGRQDTAPQGSRPEEAEVSSRAHCARSNTLESPGDFGAWRDPPPQP